MHVCSIRPSRGTANEEFTVKGIYHNAGEKGNRSGEKNAEMEIFLPSEGHRNARTSSLGGNAK